MEPHLRGNFFGVVVTRGCFIGLQNCSSQIFYVTSMFLCYLNITYKMPLLNYIFAVANLMNITLV